ncbi:MAG: YncE family protein [Pyrinomonadaceae bacterium]
MPRLLYRRARCAGAVAALLTLLSGFVWLLAPSWMRTASAQSGTSLFVRKIALSANDVVYSPATKMLYASVPSSAGAGGNSITPVDPATGAVGTPVFVGSEPDRLALADDGRTMYAVLDGAFAVRRFDVVTQTPGAQFSTGFDLTFNSFYEVNDIVVAPGEPNVVAVAENYSIVQGFGAPGVVIYDNGVMRPKAGPSGNDAAWTLCGGNPVRPRRSSRHHRGRRPETFRLN